MQSILCRLKDEVPDPYAISLAAEEKENFIIASC